MASYILYFIVLLTDLYVPIGWLSSAKTAESIIIPMGAAFVTVLPLTITLASKTIYAHIYGRQKN
ncbi:MAG: hypothetical protein AABY83_05585 [Pseudomonadota bacterium]